MNSRVFVVTAALLTMLVCAARAPGAVWQVEREWTPEEEDLFSEWFRQLSSRQWPSVNAMLKDPNYNSLYTEDDKSLGFYADCGDLPYTVRAYYAYKRGLPYIFNWVGGTGGDIRYSQRMRTVKKFDNVSFSGSLRKFFQEVSYIHSGNYRTAPDRTDSYSYPVAINRQAVRPGSIFYDPNGHAAMVSEVSSNGTIYLVDAHPDQSITRIRFGPKLEYRHPEKVGGFKWYRTVRYAEGDVFWEDDNSRLPYFSTEQYEMQNYYVDIGRKLRGDIKVDPLKEITAYVIQDTLQELKDRVESVDLGWEFGRTQAVAITPNIYAAEGDWENYSTPSRDLRLRLSWIGIADKARELLALYRVDRPSLITEAASIDELAEQIKQQVQKLMAENGISYTNSAGQSVPLTMLELQERLFKLSFDPNHVPELRWGASGDELAGAPQTPARYHRNYEQQQYWRNRLEKKQDAMSPNDSDNPRQQPEHDVIKLIDKALADVKQGDYGMPTRRRVAADTDTGMGAGQPGRPRAEQPQEVYRYQPRNQRAAPRQPVYRPRMPGRPYQR